MPPLARHEDIGSRVYMLGFILFIFFIPFPLFIFLSNFVCDSSLVGEGVNNV